MKEVSAEKPAPTEALGLFQPPASFPLHICLMLILCAIFTAVNWSFLVGSQYIPFDSSDETFPQTFFVVQSLRSGDAPWWNPLLYGGLPVLGDPQGMLFTPHVLIGTLLGSHFGQYAYDLTTLLCVLAGAVATLAYGVRVGGAPAMAFAGATVFLLGGVSTSRLQHVNFLLSYAEAPLVLLAIQRLCEKPSAGRSLILLAASLSLILNPNQVAYLALFALLPFVILHVIRSSAPTRACAYGAASAGLAVVLASPQLAAIIETVSLSTRNDMGLSLSAANSFPSFVVASLFMPGLFGALDRSGPTWSPTDITEDYLYIGIVPAALLVIVLVSISHTRAVTRIALAMAGLFFMFGLGTNWAFYPWLHEHVPGVSTFKRPADAAYQLNFMIAIALASFRASSISVRQACVGGTVASVVGLCIASQAQGLEAFAEQRGQIDALRHVTAEFWMRAGITAALAAGLAGVALLLRRRGQHNLAALVAVAGFGAWTGWDLSAAGRNTHFTFPVTVLGDAASYRDPGGILGRDDPASRMVRSLAGTNPHEPGSGRFEALGGGMALDEAMLYGLASAQGYNPLRFRSYAAVFGAQILLGEPKFFPAEAPDYNSAPYRWLGLKYVLISKQVLDRPENFGVFGADLVRRHAEFASADWARLMAVEAGYEIWELPGAYPRVSLTAADRLDWEAVPNEYGQCQMTHAANTSLDIACDTPRPARMVLEDVMAPGWFACVNGAAAEIQSFGGVFRSVLVPSGHTSVRFLYRPVPFLRHVRC